MAARQCFPAGPLTRRKKRRGLTWAAGGAVAQPDGQGEASRVCRKQAPEPALFARPLARAPSLPPQRAHPNALTVARPCLRGLWANRADGDQSRGAQLGGGR